MINFLDIMAKDNLFEKFKEQLKKDPMPVFLYGRGEAVKLYIQLLEKNNVPVECVIDGEKVSEDDETYMGIAVKSPGYVYDKYKNGYIVISAPRHRKSIVRDIEGCVKDKFLIVYFDAALDAVQENSWEVRKEYYLENRKRIEDLYAVLADDKSKECLIKVLAGSVSNDCDCYEKMAETSQYFPDFIKKRLGTKEIFVDVGAYTGDSIENFLEAVNGRYCKIYALEPDRINFEALKGKFSHEKIKCLPYGAGSGNEKMLFYHEKKGADTSAKVVKTKEAANMQIQVVRLDDVIHD